MNSTKLIDYNFIHPPYGVNYSTWDEKRARENFNWFINVVPERIQTLEQTIQRNEPNVVFVASFQPETLKPLGQWL